MTTKFNFYATFFLFFMFGVDVFAQQSIEVKDSLNNILNGQTITLTGNSNESVIKIHLESKNLSVSNKEIKVKRYETTIVPGTKNYFCWSICYNSVLAGSKPYWEDNWSIDMIPDSVYQNFSAYLVPSGQSGTSGFRYVWFDVNNINDSTYVDIIFDVTTGINDIKKEQISASVYPNPCNENFFLTLNEKLLKNGKITLFNVIGEIVYQENLGDSKMLSQIDTRDFHPGIYLAVIESEEKNSVTKKITISR